MPLVPLIDSTSSPTAYAIDLPGALAMTNAINPLVAFMLERVNEADAQAQRASVLWLPSLRAGVNYNEHEGRIQDVAGRIIETSRGSVYTGLGAQAVGAGSPAVPGVFASFHVADALFQPEIADQERCSRSQAAQAAEHDAWLQTVLGYLELLRTTTCDPLSLPRASGPSASPTPATSTTALHVW